MFTVPTTADFIALFTDFATTPTNLLDKALEVAQTFVDDTWCSQTDFEMGIFYKMAEWLTGMGQGSAPVAVGDYKEFKSGELGYKRFTAAELADPTTSSKDYGLLFLELAKRNRFGPLTTAF